MLGLFAKIFVDTTELNRAGEKLTAFGNKFEREFGSKMAKSFGVGFLAGFLVNLPGRILALSKEVDENSRRLGVNAEQWQMLVAQAEAYGITVDQMIEKNRRAGRTFSDLVKDAKRYQSEVVFSNRDVGDMENLRKFGRNVGRGLMREAAFTPGAIKDAGLNMVDWASGLLSMVLPASMRKKNPEDFFARAELRHDRASQDESSTALPLPQYAINSKLLRQARARLAQLESEEESIRVKGRIKTATDLFQPSLTSRQSIGAYSPLQGFITVSDKIDKTNERLHEIQKEVQKLNEEVRELR